MTYVLGLNASGFISSACLMKDGNIVAASTEERFTRIKKDQSFPHNAIKYCLEEAGIKFNDLDVVSSGWNPAHYMSKSSRAISQTLRDRSLFTHYIINELGSSDYCNSISNVDQNIILEDGTKLKVEHIDHHLAHASLAFYFSGLKSSLVLTLDGFGEVDAGGIFLFKNNDVKVLAKASFPHSMGMVYSTVTQFLGFTPDHDEWKVMALAASGNPSKFKEKISNLIKVGENSFNGLMEVDLSYFDYYNFFTPEYFSKKFTKVFGESRKQNEPSKQIHYDIASALQQVVEEKVLEILKHISKNHPEEKNLCLSGGFFMNSALNGKIRSQTSFNDPYIGPCPDDSGISIGSSFATTAKLLKIPQKKYSQNYFGSNFSTQKIIDELKISKIKFQELENYIEDAAKNLAEGKIIGWFQGRSEFGQRSLGNRSILASPIIPTMKDTINKFVKFREEFRPFAPAILEECKTEYFEIEENDEVFFMEKVFPFIENKKKIVPAVVHTDGTGRIQTVTKNTNKVFYELINEFYKITHVPILLNTSFNTNNVPIVDSPRDAFSTFYNCGIDILYLNNLKIEK